MQDKIYKESVGMTTEQIRQLKKEMRKKNKMSRALIDKAERERLDAAICDIIASSVSFKYADTLLLFCPTETEINVMPLFEKALSLGKRVAFPRCISRGVMKFYYTESPSDLKEGHYGIREPLECKENEFTSSSHPLCIVPCLAAAKDGSRLGYGGGYYDRFLSGFDGISACVVYDRFVETELVREKRYDKRTDLLITESGVLVVGQEK